jgi:ankyrin repeat protein
VIVRYLVNEAQIQLNFKTKEGRTALHIATIEQNNKIVEILLMGGANRFIRDKNKKIALDYSN